MERAHHLGFEMLFLRVALAAVMVSQVLGLHLQPRHLLSPAEIRAATPAMAGFGGGTPAAGKGKSKGKGKGAATVKAKISPKRQWDVYRELIKEGATPVSVFAKLPDEDKWYDAGRVVAATPGTGEEAAQYHKSAFAMGIDPSVGLTLVARQR